MKKFIIQFVLLITVIFGALYLYKAGQPPNIPFLSQKPNLQQVIINQTKINVEIADTKEERSKGLGGRESLATDSGMLFIFERLDRYQFWMKDLKFTLDFIWIRDDKIVDITENVPPQPGVEDKDLTIYQSNEQIDKLLEVNGGFASANNIKIGDIVTKVAP